MDGGIAGEVASVDAKAKAAKGKAAAGARGSQRSDDADAEGRAVAVGSGARGLMHSKPGSRNATSRPTLAAKLAKERDGTLARLGGVMADIDRLRAMEEAKRGDADRLASEAQQLEEMRAAAGLLAREASRGSKPVSVFVSRKTGRLYVRQGFDPLFDVPVMIADAGATDRHACVHRPRPKPGRRRCIGRRSRRSARRLR